MIRLWEIAALGIITGTCIIHANIFARNRIIGPWFHFIWAAVYFIPLGAIAYLNGSWWLAGVFIMERAVFYNPILNLIRQRPFFYQGSATANNHAISNILYTPILWLVYIAGFIIINIFI
jgi:hypothetical protein